MTTYKIGSGAEGALSAQQILTEVTTLGNIVPGGTRQTHTGKVLLNYTFPGSSKPCLEMHGTCVFDFAFNVQPGTNTLLIYCNQPTTKVKNSRVVIQPNSALGVSSEIIWLATSVLGWQAIGPITIAATAFGYVKVELVGYSPGASKPVYFGACRLGWPYKDLGDYSGLIYAELQAGG